MNKEVKLILGIIGFATFIIAASLLYSHFAEQYRPDALVIEGETNAYIPPQANAADAGEHTSDGEPSGDNSSDTAESDVDFAPDFVVYDSDGNEHSLSERVGKPVIVNFWASWCPPCKAEMPDFEDAYATYGEDIDFMMINLTDGSRETTESAAQYIESMGFTFPVYFDTASSAAYAYAVRSIPSTYFIAADGSIAAYARGTLDAENLEKGIAMIK